MKKTRTTRVTLGEHGKRVASAATTRSRTDWRRVDALGDKDIERAVAGDASTRVLTTRDLAASYRVPESIDVRRLRLKMHMSQGAFARKYGFSVDALQDWEQGRVTPSRSARVLLTVIARAPEAVDRALNDVAVSGDASGNYAQDIAVARRLLRVHRKESAWSRVKAEVA